MYEIVGLCHKCTSLKCTLNFGVFWKIISVSKHQLLWHQRQFSIEPRLNGGIWRQLIITRLVFVLFHSYKTLDYELIAVIVIRFVRICEWMCVYVGFYVIRLPNFISIMYTRSWAIFERSTNHFSLFYALIKIIWTKIRTGCIQEKTPFVCSHWPASFDHQSDKRCRESCQMKCHNSYYLYAVSFWKLQGKL